MQIVTVVNQKGGVGKTTTAVTLAHGLTLRGKEVVLLDLDPQGQCAIALGLKQENCVFDLLVSRRPWNEVVKPTGRERLYLIPGDKETSDASLLLAVRKVPSDFLAHLLLETFSDAQPDYIVVDTAPSVSALQELAMFAATCVIIPAATEGLSTDGTGKAIATLNSLHRQHQWAGTVLGILPTFYRENTRESRAVLKDLRAALDGGVVLPPIHDATILKECASHGQTIFERAPDSRAAKEYALLVWKTVESYG